MLQSSSLIILAAFHSAELLVDGLGLIEYFSLRYSAASRALGMYISDGSLMTVGSFSTSSSSQLGADGAKPGRPSFGFRRPPSSLRPLLTYHFQVLNFEIQFRSLR